MGTGRGVGIAIIDLTLLVDHQEYSGQLRLYEETDDIVGGWLEKPFLHRMCSGDSLESHIAKCLDYR